MRDLLRDWKRWSPAERLAAIAILLGVALVQIPVIL